VQTTLFIHKPFTCNQEVCLHEIVLATAKYFSLSRRAIINTHANNRQLREVFFSSFLWRPFLPFFSRRFFVSHYVNEVFSILYSRGTGHARLGN